MGFPGIDGILSPVHCFIDSAKNVQENSNAQAPVLTGSAIHQQSKLPFRLLNLPTQRVDPSSLHAHVGELESLTEDTFARASVAHLGDPYAAILLLGAGECLGFTPNPILDLLEGVPAETVIAEFKAKLEKQEVMLPFRALGVAYEYKDRLPIGTIVFEYDTSEFASMDLPLRRALAEEGTSTYFDAPIEESYFVVLDAEVRESAAVLTVAPTNDQPWRLFRMIYYRDAVFAGCS